MLKRVLVFFICLSTASCAGPVQLVETGLHIFSCSQSGLGTNSIVGGQNVPTLHPHTRFVQKISIERETGIHICSGAMVSERVLISAAHCFWGAQPRNVTVDFLTEAGCPADQRRIEKVRATQIIFDPQFNGNPQSFADIAVVRLASSAPSDQFVLPLIGPNQKLTSDDLLLLGYGATADAKKDSQILRAATKSLSREVQVKDGLYLLDQRSGQGGFCRGDSGAPLLGEVFLEPHIIAINSANIGLNGEGSCQSHSLAIGISRRYDWIKNQIEVLQKGSWLDRLASLF